MDVVPLLGAIIRCHGSVLWSVVKGEGDDQLWGVDVVPLQRAIVVCYVVGRGG